MDSHTKILLISAILEKVETLKDKTAKLSFGTQELTPEKWGMLGGKVQEFVYLAIKSDPFKAEEAEFIDSLEAEYEDNRKSESQRLRAVLYRCWEQEPEDYADFNLYYKFKMEKLINHFKAKLP